MQQTHRLWRVPTFSLLVRPPSYRATRVYQRGSNALSPAKAAKDMVGAPIFCRRAEPYAPPNGNLIRRTSHTCTVTMGDAAVQRGWPVFHWLWMLCAPAGPKVDTDAALARFWHR